MNFQRCAASASESQLDFVALFCFLLLLSIRGKKKQKKKSSLERKKSKLTEQNIRHRKLSDWKMFSMYMVASLL